MVSSTLFRSSCRCVTAHGFRRALVAGMAAIFAAVPLFTVADSAQAAATASLGSGVRAVSSSDTPLIEVTRRPAGSARIVINDGHLDVVGALRGNMTDAAVRDDSRSASEHPVVRPLDDLIVSVGDNAKETRTPQMSSPSLDALGPVGTSFYWLPQTQKQGIVWPGYNTQDIDYSRLRGPLNLHFEVLRAPADARVALLLDLPLGAGLQTLADTASGDTDIETTIASHTHTNWLFSHPGFYELRFSYTGKLTDGTVLRPRSDVLRIAVGDKASRQVQSGKWVESPIRDEDGSDAGWTVQRATAPRPATTGFVDVPATSQFAGEIEWMRVSKLSTGWPDRTYRPLHNVNRDAVIAFFWRMAGEPAVSTAGGTGFRDVPTSDSFAKPITWAKQQGLTTGWATPGGAEFRPTIPIERQAYMAMLHRFCTKFSDRCAPNLLKVKPLSGKFSDVPAGHQFAANINWGAAAGITTGWPDQSFRGQEPIHRDAIAAFLYRAQHNRVVKR